MEQIINAIEGYLKKYQIDDTFHEQAKEIYQLIKPIIEMSAKDNSNCFFIVF